MKHLLPAAVLLAVLSVQPPAATAGDEDIPARFSEVLTMALEEYPGTSAPDLPAEVRDNIKRELSTVPGRMFMPRNIHVRKDACRLYLRNALGDTLMNVPVCSARNRGQKHTRDDCRTYEGTVNLYGAYISTDWTYKDTNQKCYGPFFLAINTPFYTGIGIHGTNAPGSVPGRRSHGCMRLHNEDIETLQSMVTKDILVTIFPDKVDPDTEKETLKAEKRKEHDRDDSRRSSADESD